MKAYLFNSENGIYQGETFEDPDSMKYVDGITPIAPPHYERDQVPVFVRIKREWAVIPVTVANQLLNISTSESLENRL